MIELAPSLLSADFTKLDSEIEKLNRNNINYLHLDVMDGIFVPNISFGPAIIKSLRPLSKMVFDVHLMIDKPERFIEVFKNAGADILTVHVESTLHLHSTIQAIKKLGMKAGVSLNPATSLSVLDCILEDIDLVLLMSVNPGFGGQKYIEFTDRKLKNLSRIKKDNNLNFIIEVDGGVKTTNVKRVIENGAELIVSGSDVFCAEDIDSRINEYKEIFKSYE